MASSHTYLSRTLRPGCSLTHCDHGVPDHAPAILLISSFSLPSSTYSSEPFVIWSTLYKHMGFMSLPSNAFCPRQTYLFRDVHFQMHMSISELAQRSPLAWHGIHLPTPSPMWGHPSSLNPQPLSFVQPSRKHHSTTSPSPCSFTLYPRCIISI